MNGMMQAAAGVMHALSGRAALVAGILAVSAASLMLLQSLRDATEPPLVELPAPATTVATEPRPAPELQAVASRDIRRGTTLDAAALELAPLAGEREAPAAIEPLLGRVALDGIRRGQPLRPDLLSPTPDPGGLAPLVPVGLRAVSLRVAEDTGVGHLLRPGDRVDMLLVTRPEAEERDAGRPLGLAQTLLQDVQVLAVGEALHPEPPTAAQTRPQGQRHVTLAVSPAQALAVGLARADGGYVLSLRNPLDREVVDTPRLLRTELLDPTSVPNPAPTAPTPAAAPARAARTGPLLMLGPAGGGR